MPKILRFCFESFGEKKEKKKAETYSILGGMVLISVISVVLKAIEEGSIAVVSNF